MAASITGTFTLLDRASGPMRRMERQAIKTQVAIEGVGKRLDAITNKTRSSTRAFEALDVELTRKQREFRKLENQLGKTEKAMASQAKATELHARAQRNQSREMDQATKATRDQDDANRRTTKSSSTLSQSLRKLGGSANGLRAIFTALKFPAIIAGFGLLAQAASGAAAGIIALLPRIGDLSGALAAVPFAVGAAIQGIATFKLAISGVMDAVKAGIQMQDQSARSTRDFADQQRQAARSVRDAEWGIQDAQRASRDSQLRLTEARRAARRELTDMRLAASGAALGERRAALSLRQARQSLNQGRNRGVGGTQLEDLRLSVSEARLGLRQARVDARRAQQDNRRTQAAGVSGNRGVIDARRNITDAARGQTRALEALGDATRAQNRLMADGTPDAQRYAEAMKKLSPEARTFVEHMLSLRGTVRDLRREAGRELFPSLDRSLTRATRGVPMLKRILRTTGGVIGRNVAAGTRELTTPARLHDIEGIAGTQTRIIGDAGAGARNLASALIDFMVAARPFTEWLSDTMVGWSEWIRYASLAGRETGSTARFLTRSQTSLESFGRIIKSIYGALQGVGRAARPLGNELYQSIERGAARWDQWSNSFTGQSRMRLWFEQMRPVIYELVGLTGDVARALARLASDPGSARFIRQIRDMVPDLERMVRNVRDAFGGPLLDTIGQIARLLSNLSGMTTPIGLIFGALRRVLGIINDLIETVPGLGTVLSAALSVLLINRFIGRVRVLRDVWKAAAGWAGRSGGPGGGGTGGRGGGGTGGGGGGGGAPVIVGGGGGGGGGRGGGGGGGGARGGRFGRLGRLGTAARRGVRSPTVLGTAGLVAGSLIAGAVGGGLGDAAGGALSGAGIGATVGSIIPGLGTGAGALIGGVLGGAYGLFGGQGKRNQAAQTQAQHNADVTASRGVGATRARIAQLQGQLGVTEYQHLRNVDPNTGRVMPGTVLGARNRNYVGGAERKRSQAELNKLRGRLPAMENAAAAGIAGSMSSAFGVYQQGNAGQRRSGRWAVAQQYVTEFRKMGPEGKRALAGSTAQWVEQLKHGDASQRRMARLLTRQIKGEWSDMGQHIQIVNGQILTGSQTEWKQIQKALEDPVEKARQAVSKGFTDMQRQAVGSLVAMGYSRSDARKIIKTSELTGGDVGAAAGQVASGQRYAAQANAAHARGGRIPGQGMSDSVMVAPGQIAAPKELIVNRHTEARQNAINSMVGAPPLGALVAGETKRHAQAFARGGRIQLPANFAPTHQTAGLSGYPSVDVFGSPGSLVGSPISGTVTKFSGRSPSEGAYMGQGGPFGYSMYVSGGKSTYFLTHFGSRDVRVGQHVARGQNLGTIGDYPGATPDHIHEGKHGGPMGVVRGSATTAGAAAAAPNPVTAPSVNVAGAAGGVANAALAMMAAGLNNKIGADAGGGATGGRYSGGGGLNSWLTQALKITGHYSAANLAGLRTMAMGESGGDPNAIQKIQDINSQTGNLARGLLQVIPPTFAANHLPGHDNIMNPVDNAIASIRYQYARYGHIVGHAGYAMGGRLPDWGGWNAEGGTYNVTRPTVFGAGEAGHETVKITPKGKGGGGGRTMQVTVNIEHYNVEGQIKDAIKREMASLADDLALVGADDDA